ncbi:hypothetical protein [Acidianus brierleyi]|uniref:Uncharacterized protein n=1 Tax=Acidianus brierleyi TaxID=41673 RepID=A0A2U9IDM4_9CREN|nr:hypothetical protein [Acidianus brierleyi]AWR94132.1 hypothetical protein DFR85_05525 [Acidianus brierleyi]
MNKVFPIILLVLPFLIYFVTNSIFNSIIIGSFISLFYFLASGGKKYTYFVPYASSIILYLSIGSLSIGLISIFSRVSVLLNIFFYSFLATLSFTIITLFLGYMKVKKNSLRKE